MCTVIGPIKDLDVVWVWVTDAVSADTLHDTAIKTVELLEASHVVVCTVVNGTNILALAFIRLM